MTWSETENPKEAKNVNRLRRMEMRRRKTNRLTSDRVLQRRPRATRVTRMRKMKSPRRPRRLRGERGT